jgi:hypothetical protein
VQNGTETDIDCGGGACTACGDGKKCSNGTRDCTSLFCNAGTCQATVCGDNVAQGPELCDGTDLKGATCDSLGHAPGALVCNGSCTGFDTSGCTNGYAAANTGFTGKVYYDGLRWTNTAINQPVVFAATEASGVMITSLPAQTTPATWAAANTGVTTLNMHALSSTVDGPPLIVVTDGSGASNVFRTNNNGTSFTATAMKNGATTLNLFSVISGTSTNNLFGGWDATLGAFVIHGTTSLPNVNATLSVIGTGITGTVRSLARGGTSSSTSRDVYAVVNGTQPDGTAGAGGGIYWSCDIVGPAGGTFAEADNGLSASDKQLVWAITSDPLSYTNTPARMCGATAISYASTVYVALRGGGSLYKTSDGGMTWAPSATGLPSGAEVYAIAISARDNTVLYAATNSGVYKSTNAGATWALHGLEGLVVRAITLDPRQTAGSSPMILAGVDGATTMYQRLPTTP